ncbi:isoprenyl transferase [Ponticaulis sp.]|uniref:isoprenyl transferase n=1 Tax=Ponticaulis sp. TaxID=2020902 RepID=UPI000B74AE02|nr:isoprenyl transferase [Ponticaulis sp.]MAI89441.1 di-trans,poly-cis-decaprenylcistransferase [Ponticaulis sp.]OUY00479.1 MAG: di-trans,poly-cis-decaprenylcistransferase [Hyphomonadaceae bacterium TMED5]|tara:strand:- start:89892 stop:90623 length:732 start_codon:yes stop_codon:yes gene_type:complete
MGDASADIKHIAIIMDGNGRWAKQRGLPRQAGHERGVEALRRTVRACQGLSLQHLTVFSFSSENWKRPAAEISSLFSLLRLYVQQDLKKLAQDGVKVRVLGSRSGLPDDILKLIEKAEGQTAHNTEFNLNIAFNYGSRDELVEASRAIAQRVKTGELQPEDITTDIFSESMWFGEIPDPDLLVRTSGEYRLSNFLLWQIAYSELVFMDCLWPDFGEEHLKDALGIYKCRDRRYGGLTVNETEN